MSTLKAWAVLFVALTLSYTIFACADRHQFIADDPTREPAPTLDLGTPEIWPTPGDSALDNAAVLKRYANVDPQGIVPKNLLNKTLLFYDKNKNRVTNENHIGIVDFSRHSSRSRFYIIGLNDGSVAVIHAAHGSGSDPKNTGDATLFSNTPESHMSSLGFYLTAEEIQHHGAARKLDGLSTTNSNARARHIWLHSASYVVERSVQPGRSWGCLAVSFNKRDWVMKTLSAGSLLYVGQSAKD